MFKLLKLPAVLVSQLKKKKENGSCDPKEGGGGGGERLHPKFKPLTLLHVILDRKGIPLIYLPLTKWSPFNFTYLNLIRNKLKYLKPEKGSRAIIASASSCNVSAKPSEAVEMVLIYSLIN